MTWRCAYPFSDKILLSWDDEQHAVFFDPATGDTHLVSSLAVLIADILGAASMDFDELLQGVRDSVETDVGQDLEDTLHHHLRRLTAIGLLQETAP